MAGSLNRAMLIGRLGADPEIRYTSSGIAVCTFSLATSESWKNQEGEKQEKTEWHNIVAWRKLAEFCGEYLKKGSLVYVGGKITTEKYDDKNGVTRYTTKIVIDEMRMLESKQQESATHTEHTHAPVSGHPDDLPF